MPERETSAEFNELWDKLPSLKAKPSQDDQLSLYAYGKVAKNLEIGEKPGAFQLAAKAKYNKWNAVLEEKVTPEQAEQKYIALAKKLIADIGVKDA